MKVRVIPADSHLEPYDTDIRDGHVLADLQKLVGGWIEVVRTQALLQRYGRFAGDGYVVMVVNEEGLITGLPFNDRASELYPGPTPIAGTAVLIGEADVIVDGFPDRDFVPFPEVEQVR